MLLAVASAFFSPWSSGLSSQSILVTCLCGFGCTLSSDGSSLSPPSLGFTNACPYFSLLSYQTAWTSGRYLNSPCLKQSSASAPQNLFCLHLSCTTIHLTAAVSNLVLTFYFFHSLILHLSSATKICHFNLSIFWGGGLFSLTFL